MIATTSLAEKTVVLIQASNVRAFVGFREGELETTTNWLTPLKLKACPTSPAAKVVPLTRTPWLLSMLSRALPSPRHELIIPGGVGVQPLAHLPALPAL